MKNFSIFLFMLISTIVYAASDPEITGIRQNADSIGLFDKFELQISLKAICDNPFDPEDISIIAVFTAPSGKKWTIDGFYNYTGWRSLWMVRFSPMETGTWGYVINVKNRNGKVSSSPKTFEVVPSHHHGPLRIAPNKRYFEYADGTPFYGVGFWYNDSYRTFNRGNIKAAELDKLKELGVNIISSFITPLETVATGVGRYDQNICGRLDELLGWMEDRDMQLSLNVWFHPYLSETVWGGGNILWETNPYQTVCDVKDFYSNEKAWKYQEQMYRYLIARWGYSRSLALWFIIDEVNGTDGWTSGDSLGAARWAQKVQQFFNEHDPYHHPTTGTRSGGIKEWWQEGYQTFDVAAREIYEAQGFPIVKSGTLKTAKENPLRYSYFNYAGQIRKLWKNFDKPAIIGETGWDHTFFEFHMPGYLAQYHNALWVCLTTGTAMTPLWWSHNPRLNSFLKSNQLTSIRNFTGQIPFSKLTHVAPMNITVTNGDAFAIKSDQMIFGWAVNPDTDVAGDTITVSSLKPGKYKVRLFHTWRGQFFSEKEIFTSDGTVKITIPVMHNENTHARYFGQDAAFILQLKE